MSDNTEYVIVSSTGSFFDGIHNGESVVWLNNLQSVEPYINLKFAERHLTDAQNESLWRGDSDARICAVARDDKGYLHLGGAI